MGCVGVHGRGYCTVDCNNLGAYPHRGVGETNHDETCFDWWAIICPGVIIADDEATMVAFKGRFGGLIPAFCRLHVEEYLEDIEPQTALGDCM